MSPRVAASLKVDALGTTFGGGPMACAIIEAVIDTIESEGLLANVRRLSAEIRATCAVGPVTGFQGAGFLLGMRTRRPAKDVQRELLERDILVGTSADPAVVRLLPAFTLGSEHVSRLRDALAGLPS
jgi:acetylornithine/succinyldiaminopimelate/putrescine aminotransferase